MNGCCPTCGRKLDKPRTTRYWTHERIVDAIRLWNDRYGQPPVLIDWHNSGPDWPGQRTVMTRFGSWNNAIAAAGFEPLGAGGRRNGRRAAANRALR